MLTFVDNIVIVIAVLGVVGIGMYFSKSITDMESYYLANRSLPWSLVVGTLMASWYGGNGVVGSIGYASLMGFSTWFIWSIGCHLVRFPLALWVGPRVHIRSDVTIPDMMESTYGKAAALIASLFLFVYCSQIGEITATGIIGQAAWGIDKLLLGIIVVVITILLTCLGGLMGVAVTDMIFFFFMVASVCLVFPNIYQEVGGLVGLRTIMDAQADFPGFMHPTAGMSVPKMVMFIMLSINVYADPTFYQRFSVSKTAKSSRRAMLTCFCIWLAFDLVLVFGGIIVRATDPAVVSPELAYIEMVLTYLPTGLRALFIIGLFGAIISTLDSYYLIGGTTLAKDIYARAFAKKELDDRALVRLSRIGSVILGVIGLCLAFRFTLVYDAVLFLSSMWMSTAFAPIIMALMYRGKKTTVAGLASMITGSAVFAWFYMNPLVLGELGAIDALLLGVPASFVAFIIGNRFGKDINANNPKIQA
mgnify:FL=1